MQALNSQSEKPMSPVKFERDGAVARLVLSRPDAGNSIDVATARALLEHAIACDEDAGIRAVVLTGEGRMFCVGGDIRAFGAAGDKSPALIKEITSYLHAAISRLMHMNKPLITAINGPAAGAGLSLAVLGDIAIARMSAHFTMAYTAVGLSPDGGSSWFLPRLIGLRRTQELALLNRRVSAEDAAQMGLITRAVADEAFEDEVARLARQLAASATGGIGRTRNLLLASFNTPLEAQMDAEARSIAEGARSEHGQRAIAAFLAKQTPDFST